MCESSPRGSWTYVSVVVLSFVWPNHIRTRVGVIPWRPSDSGASDQDAHPCLSQWKLLHCHPHRFRAAPASLPAWSAHFFSDR
jgi:hypothetical protein